MNSLQDFHLNCQEFLVSTMGEEKKPSKKQAKKRKKKRQQARNKGILPHGSLISDCPTCKLHYPCDSECPCRCGLFQYCSVKCRNSDTLHIPHCIQLVAVAPGGPCIILQ